MHAGNQGHLLNITVLPLWPCCPLRLRNKLEKLDYIKVFPVAINGKPRMVVQLLRPYLGGRLMTAAQQQKLLQRRAAAAAAGYEDAEEDDDGLDDDDDGNEGGTGEAEGEGEGTGEQEGEAGDGEEKEGGYGDYVEQSWARGALAAVCSAGPQGLLSTELNRLRGPCNRKTAHRKLQDLVKKYNLQVGRGGLPPGVLFCLRGASAYGSQYPRWNEVCTLLLIP